jgi:hypothetical protein
MTTPGWYPDGQGNTRWWDGRQWTQQIQPSQASPPPPPPYVPPLPAGHRSRSKRSAAPWIVLGVAVIALVVAIAAIVGVSSHKKKPAAAPTLATQSSYTPIFSSEPAAAPDLRPADFKIAIKIKEQQCFGDAGCDIDVDPAVVVGSGRSGL